LVIVKCGYTPEMRGCSAARRDDAVLATIVVSTDKNVKRCGDDGWWFIVGKGKSDKRKHRDQRKHNCG
jgi:hypothetical protein